MEWPSKNVPPGGIFHTQKVKYSDDTKNYLKLLIDESHMNNRLRDKVNYTLRNGIPLPKLSSDAPSSYRKRIPEPPVLIRPGNCGRRRKETIVQSGAYELPTFVPDRSGEDREKAKERLQFIMANGKEGLEKRPKRKIKIETPKPFNKFDEIVKEIEERQKWLKEMEELGEAHKYRDLINMQIEGKLRELEQMKAASEVGDGDRK